MIVSAPDSVEVSVVMPCLNEAETLAHCIMAAQHALSTYGIRGEIIISDNGSTDGSPEVARRCGAHVIEVAQRGYGAALRSGINAAQGTFVIMADSDSSYDLGAIPVFLDRLRAGDQLVVGTRLKGLIQPGAMPRLHRWIGNPALTLIGNVLFGTHLSDYHCGMRGFNRQAILHLRLYTPGMEFATEMIAKAALHKLRIIEVPITYRPAGRSGVPHLRPWIDGWRHLRFMLILHWQFYHLHIHQSGEPFNT